MTSNLRADLHVTELISIVTQQPLPFGIPYTWSHMASTLISGDKEAILIDPPLTIKQGHEVSEWIEGVLGPTKKLTTIYITHGHGDHYFAASAILKHFPHVKIYATKGTIEHMAQQIGPDFYNGFWSPSFPGELEPPSLDLVKVLDGNTIDLEGHAINIIEAGQSDTYDSTFVHIPDLDMVVAGDVCYNELHQWLAEALDEDKRNAWIAALEKVISLKPATVVASHKRPGAVDGINNVYATIEYIKAFGECKAESSNAEELYHKMLARYPQRINPIILWIASQVTFLSLDNSKLGKYTCGILS